MSTSLNRIKRLSRTMEYISSALIILLPLCLFIVWSDKDIIKAMAFLSGNNWHNNLTPLVQVLGFIISMIPAGIVMYGLVQLRRLFKYYQQGHIFTEGTAYLLRRFAWALLLSGLIRPFIGAALSVLLTFNNPPGERMLAINISSNDIALLFIGAIFILIASIMVEGTRLAEDNAQIV